VFSLLNLFFSIEAKDERESAFSLSTFSDRTFLLMAGLSLLLTVLATIVAPCQAILKTTELDESQWLLCAGAALSIIAASEIRKMVLRRRGTRSAASLAQPPRLLPSAI
jgi:P-type Ca2+ transporter type 2C